MGSVQKVVLVTAGSAGLGAAVAKAFAADHRVIINYSSNKQRADKLIEELEAINGTQTPPKTPRFLAIQADAGDREALTHLVKHAVDQMGRLDVVVSNHGWTRLSNFMDLDDNVVDADWDRCFTMNVKSHLWLMHAAKPHLESSSGAFISTASIAGIKPGGSSLAYSVTKAALIHLNKGLAVICSPKVRVNSVSPGLLLTDWGMKFPEAKRRAATENTRLKRLATVEDVAAQVRTLASSQSMTGQNLSIDGGALV